MCAIVINIGERQQENSMIKTQVICPSWNFNRLCLFIRLFPAKGLLDLVTYKKQFWYSVFLTGIAEE